MAVWQSGHAAACKAVYAGSIPASASKKKAQVAKQVDARDLKSLGYKTSVPVRFRPWAPYNQQKIEALSHLRGHFLKHITL